MVQNNSMLDKVNSVLQQVQTFPQIKKKQKKVCSLPTPKLLMKTIFS